MSRTQTRDSPTLDKPTVNFETIPQELKDVPQWVLWRYEDGRKVPYQVSGYRASSTNPEHWSTFDVAREAYDRGGYSGVGFVFTDDDAYCGIDLDDCRVASTGVLADWATEIISRLNSYAEVSPSGTGVKLIVRGNPGATGQRPYDNGKVEVYKSRRYFTITGQVVKAAAV